MTEAVGTVPGTYLDESQRKGLLGIARRALDGYLGAGKIPPEEGVRGKLAAHGAAFVTLTKNGRLRGCIGYTEAVAPLFKVVQECAVAAATEDPRFPPVSPEELPSLRVEISVLTPLFPIRPEEVVIGTIEAGYMTKDLALLVGAEQAWLSTTGFLDKIDENLQKAMG